VPGQCDLLVKLMWPVVINMTSSPARMAVLCSTRPSAGEADEGRQWVGLRSMTDSAG
jgi:hypothetical protein